MWTECKASPAHLDPQDQSVLRECPDVKVRRAMLAALAPKVPWAPRAHEERPETLDSRESRVNLDCRGDQAHLVLRALW